LTWPDSRNLFAASGPKSVHRSPARAAREDTRKRSGAEPTSCSLPRDTLCSSAGCWVLAGWTEAQSLRRASQLCRRGSKLGQVQKGKTKIAEKLQRHRTAPTDTYSRRVKKRRTAPPTGLQLSWRTVAVAAKFSSKIVPPPGMQVQEPSPWPCRVRRSALFYACSVLARIRIMGRVGV
jgi:hypothetical protein